MYYQRNQKKAKSQLTFPNEHSKTEQDIPKKVCFKNYFEDTKFNVLISLILKIFNEFNILY